MTEGVLPFAAFGAGIVTFISPCILPLVPAYIAFMTGAATNGHAGDGVRTRATLYQSLLFVLGFTLVFVSLGASASVLGGFLVTYGKTFDVVAGILLVAMGVFMLGVIRIPWLYGEVRFTAAHTRRLGSLAALGMGAAFAFGWSPCVGPILGSILMMAANVADVGKGVVLLALYSLGLGVPFVLVALLLERITRPLAWLKRYSVVINRIAAVVLIAVGALIASGHMAVVAGAISRFIPQIGG